MVARVAAILRAFEPEEISVGVSELARRSGLPKSSASRIIADLVAHGLLERDGAGVRLGIRVFELGEAVQRRHLLRRLALPFMMDLRAASQLTVHLAVLESTEVVYLEILRARGAPSLATRVGGRLPAYSTAVGKALLAWSPDSIVQQVMRAPFAPVGPRTMTAGATLMRELNEIRETGIAYDREESRSGISAVATALLGPDSAPLLALSVVGRQETMHCDEIARRLKTTGTAFARSLRTRPAELERLRAG